MTFKEILEHPRFFHLAREDDCELMSEARKEDLAQLVLIAWDAPMIAVTVAQEARYSDLLNLAFSICGKLKRGI